MGTINVSMLYGLLSVTTAGLCLTGLDFTGTYEYHSEITIEIDSHRNHYKKGGIVWYNSQNHQYLYPYNFGASDEDNSGPQIGYLIGPQIGDCFAYLSCFPVQS